MGVQWTIGEIAVTKITELEVALPGGGGAVPDAQPDAVREIPWIAPDWATDEGRGPTAGFVHRSGDAYRFDRSRPLEVGATSA